MHVHAALICSDCKCSKLHSVVHSLLYSLLMTVGSGSPLVALTSGDGGPRWGAS